MAKKNILKMQRLAVRIESARQVRESLKDRAKKAYLEGDARQSFKLWRELSKRSRLESPTRHRRVCGITGYARRCWRVLGICGHEIRRAIDKNLLFGLKLVNN